MTKLIIVTAAAPVLLFAAAVQAQTSPAPGDNATQAERRICRAMARPGSLAGSRRVCMTRAEWDRAAETARRESEEMVAGRDSCDLRGQGGTPIVGGPAQQTAAAMERIAGC